MRVTAITRGYHGRLREAGDVFEVPESAKATWFEPVAAQETKAAPKAKASAKASAEAAPVPDAVADANAPLA